MSDIQREEPKYPRRSFGFVKNETLDALGSSAAGATTKLIMMAVVVVLLLIFVNFHAIYLKTGVPMFAYGFSMSVLQPFYTLWALFVVLSKYLFGN